MKTFQNILIVRTDRIGDVVLTTPAIKALRQAYPAARISILVTPMTFDLVNGNPYIDEILMDDRHREHKGLFGFWRLVRELRLKQFDLAVIFHTKRRYNSACFMAGIPCRLGFKNNKFGFLLTHPINDLRASGAKHEAEYCMDVLKVIGIDHSHLDILVPIQKDAEAWGLNWMQENDVKPNEFIVIHPGASDETKCWPAINFAQLIDGLYERYSLKLILIGSPQIKLLADEILQKTAHGPQILNLTGKTSLGQTVSLLRRSRLLISNDSGPVHVAAGVGCSVISIFLRNQPGINAKRWGPLGPKSYVLTNKPGEEIKLDTHSQAIAGQAGSIKVDEVLNLVGEIFHRNGQYEIF